MSPNNNSEQEKMQNIHKEMLKEYKNFKNKGIYEYSETKHLENKEKLLDLPEED